MATHTFKSTTASLAYLNGPVTVIRSLDPDNPEDSYDAEVGPMFRVRSDKGREFDAFGDELTDLQVEVEETIADNAKIEAAFQDARDLVGNIIIPDEHDPRL